VAGCLTLFSYFPATNKWQILPDEESCTETDNAYTRVAGFDDGLLFVSTGRNEMRSNGVGSINVNTGEYVRMELGGMFEQFGQGHLSESYVFFHGAGSLKFPWSRDSDPVSHSANFLRRGHGDGDEILYRVSSRTQPKGVVDSCVAAQPDGGILVWGGCSRLNANEDGCSLWDNTGAIIDLESIWKNRRKTVWGK
jgi:hypothetical protein